MGDKTELTWWRTLVPGFAQGLVRATISYPLDVVKTNAQTRNMSPWIVSKDIFRHNPSLLYRGFPYAALGVMCERGLSFGIFEAILAKHKDSSPFACAFATAVPCSIVSVPIMSITSNVVVGDHQSGSVAKYVQKSCREKGLSFFFRAYPQEVARSVIGGTIFMGTYAWCRKTLDSTSVTATSASAILAGMTVWSVQYPWDTIRTLVQTDNSARKVSIVQTAKNRVQAHGIASLYRGLSAVIVRTVPSSIVGMVVYEFVRARF